MSPPAAVFFDLDGTLVDTADDLIAALAAVCEAESHPVPEFQLARTRVSDGSAGLLELAFGTAQSEQDRQRRTARFLDHYRDNLCRHSAPFPGMYRVLDAMETRATPWGIVTNKPERFTTPLLAKLSFGRPAVVISGDTLSVSKPHPDPLLEAARLTGVEPDNCVYIGDAERDIQAGKAAGMKTGAALWGYIADSEATKTWRADRNLATPLDLHRWLFERSSATISIDR